MVKKTKKLLPVNYGTPSFKICSSLNEMFILKSQTQTEQCFSTTEGSLTLNHVSVDIEVNVEDDYQEQIHRILKKRLPLKLQIQLLYAPAKVIMRLMISFDFSVIITGSERKNLRQVNDQY